MALERERAKLQAFFSIAMHRASASSTATMASSISACSLALSLSRAIAFPFKLLTQPSASANRDCSFNLADSASSALAKPSFSYFCLHIWESPTDLEAKVREGGFGQG